MSTNELGASFLLKLNANDLERIQKVFKVWEVSNNNELIDKDRFCKLMSSVLTAKGTDEEFSGFFENIDVLREGQINWNRMCNHILLEYYEKDGRTKVSEVPQWEDLKHISNCKHKNFINRVMMHSTNTSRYVAVSRDGIISFLDQKFNVVRSHQIQTNQDEMKSKDLWVTDAVVLLNHNKIAISTTSKQIWFYDISSKHKFVCQYKVIGFQFIPLCLSFWAREKASNCSNFAVGDTNGDVYIFFFTTTNGTLFDRPLKSDKGQDTCFIVDLTDILSSSFPSVSCFVYHAHSAWVRKLIYAPTLDCFMSCATTIKDSIVLAWLGKSKKDVRLTTIENSFGINSFDFHAELNLIATAGIDCRICLWNPYVVSKPVGVLTGHMHILISVCFTHSNGQLLSLSKDRVLRLWDVNLKICLQKLTGLFPKSFEPSVFIFYDQAKSCMLMSFNNQLYVLQQKNRVNNRIVSHDAPVTGFIYNEKFGQIISVCELSGISIWFLSTGQKVKHISDAHGKNEITAVTLNYSGTRILTAGTDGIIKVWDMNGVCYHELIVENKTPCEISQVLCIKSMILAMGWSRDLCYFPISQMRSYEIEPVEWKGKRQHLDDILTADFKEPRTLVTASYSGEIIFWNTNTQNSNRKIVTEPLIRNRSKTLPPLKSATTSPLKTRRLVVSHDHITSLATKRAESFDVFSSPMMTSLDAPQHLISVTCVKFLKFRNNHDPQIADMYSCHSDGSIQFWNSLTCEKVCAFVCFDTFGAIVSCVDDKNHFLGIGGECGSCKIYDIKDYAIHRHEVDLNSSHIKTCSEPNIVASFQVHNGAITCIDFVPKNDLLFVLTSSCDYSIALHCFGHLVGIFGQTEHWNVNDLSLKDSAQKSLLKSEPAKFNQSKVDSKDFVHDTLKPRATEPLSRLKLTYSECDTPDLEREVKEKVVILVEDEKTTSSEDKFKHFQTWDQTVLGKAYQELRKTKRSRKQPYALNKLTTDIPVGKQTHSYRYLHTNEMSETMILNKPNFLTNPEWTFIDKSKDEKSVQENLPRLVDELKLCHDDKSIFPKYILDMETTMKAANKMTNTSTGTSSRLSSKNSIRLNEDVGKHVVLKKKKTLLKDFGSKPFCDQ